MLKSMSVFAIFILMISLIGCQSKKEDIINLQYPEEQKQIEKAVHEIFKVAKQKDFAKLESLHLIGPKFTKFDDWEPLDRQDAQTAMKAERDAFSQITDLSVQINDFKADVFGAVAVSTFIINYSMKAGPDQIAAKARGTLVFVKVGDSWKITHEHFSPFKSNP
jgi:hypothetical protein